jgi:hypothetical protein
LFLDLIALHLRSEVVFKEANLHLTILEITVAKNTIGIIKDKPALWRSRLVSQWLSSASLEIRSPSTREARPRPARSMAALKWHTFGHFKFIFKFIF